MLLKITFLLTTFFKKNLSFYADFGPLNLAMVYRYCCKLNKKLKVSIAVMLYFGIKISNCDI